MRYGVDKPPLSEVRTDRLCGVDDGAAVALPLAKAGRSACHCPQTDVRNWLRWQVHVASPLHGPFTVLLDLQRRHEAHDCFIGEDADDLGARLISPLSRATGI